MECIRYDVMEGKSATIYTVEPLLKVTPEKGYLRIKD